MSSDLTFITNGETFHNGRYPDFKVDFILANPPSNVSDLGSERLRDERASKESRLLY